VKGLLPELVAGTGSQIILGNTYHLMLRPGEKTIAELGGLHRFMAWAGPILTDSGGFQVFSLADLNRISDEGVWFKSHVDGGLIELTPRRSMEVQNALGADIIMAFDQCPSGTAPADVQALAVERTLRWAQRSLMAHQRPGDQSLFGIVQGGTDLDLRQRCAAALIDMNFPGYAIGGLAVGEGFEAMGRVLAHVTPMLPEQKPRYLMGVGFPRDIVAAVARGVDMFDCVMPTRNGRNAYAFTADGPMRLRNSQYARDSRPVEEGCDCHACLHFERGAIRHFFFASEMLGPILLSLHNIRFYQRLMADIRRSIAQGTFERFARSDARCVLGPSANDPQTGPLNDPAVDPVIDPVIDPQIRSKGT
jgi:queuine tRNA-ribosyltransferase